MPGFFCLFGFIKPTEKGWVQQLHVGLGRQVCDFPVGEGDASLISLIRGVSQSAISATVKTLEMSLSWKGLAIGFPPRFCQGCSRGIKNIEPLATFECCPNLLANDLAELNTPLIKSV